MKKDTNIKLIGLAITLALVVFIAPNIVFAKDGSTTETNTTEKTVSPTTIESTNSNGRTPSVTKSTNTETHATETKSVSDDATSENTPEIKRERLPDVKKKVCVDHQTQINTIMKNVIVRSKNAMTHITTAADRTEAFYIKQGNVLSAYGSLVAKVNNEKVIAQTAVDALSTVPAFSCDSTGPKSDIQHFSKERHSKISAVSAYRDAVKALIAGVKSVQPQTTPGKQ